MSEYKLVVIQTDGNTETQDKYNGLEFSAISGIEEAVSLAKQEDVNIYTSIQEQSIDSSITTS